MSAAAVADKTVKFLSTTVGRDRINRFVQYFTRFLAWHFQRSGASKETLERLHGLLAAMGQTRKIMRTGRQIEFMRGVAKSLSVRDEVVRATTIFKSVFMALWLSFDTCQWLHAAKVVKFENIKDIGERSFKCWLAALLFSFAGDVYKLNQNYNKIALEAKKIKSPNSDEVANGKKTIQNLNAERAKLWVTTIQDGVDILLPASGLEYIKLETGIVGLAGAFTSILGGYTHWNSI